MFASIPYTTTTGESADTTKTNVFLYSLSFCEQCAQARTLLQELDVPFAMIQLDLLDPETRRPAMQGLREAYGQRVIYPVLEIDGEMTFGYNREVWLERLQPVAHAV